MPSVHQPRMKVFTVGLEDKEKAKQHDEKSDMTKIPIDSSASTPAPSPAPIILPRGPPRRHKGCGVIAWLVAAFFVVLLCLTISEIAYNRQRDQAFLRLKWAELRQRMLGYELLSQAQQQQNTVDERLAFNRRNDMEALPLRETPTVPAIVDNVDHSHENDKSTEPIGDAGLKFGFLHDLLERMREKAADMGLSGDMQVHVIEVKPMKGEEQMNQRAWEDGFGEVAVPKQYFGPSQRDEDYQDYDSMRRAQFAPVWPQQFDRESMRPMPWQMDNRFPEWNQQWNNQQRGPFGFSDYPQDNRMFGDAGMDQRNVYGQMQQPMRMPFPMQQPAWNQQPNFQMNPFENQQQDAFGFNQMPVDPSVGQQNQFQVQNQQAAAPAVQQARPWYMNGGDDERWTETWNNDWQQHKQPELPMQPHPAASAIDNNWHLVDADKNPNTRGMDNFKTQERFNVPVDVASDSAPITIDKSEPASHEFHANAWQHTQPEAAKESAPAVAPSVVSSDAHVERDFLPIRHDDDPADISGESVDVPMPPSHDDADMQKKFNSPFFQIDDPSSFRH